MSEPTRDNQLENSSDQSTDYLVISSLEEAPRDEWFFEKVDEHGKPLVYLRVQISGMLPRIVGPFESRTVALWCLDQLVNSFDLDFVNELTDLVARHGKKRPFHARLMPVMVEDPLIVEVRQSMASGRPTRKRVA